jgi:hypothetical protein
MSESLTTVITDTRRRGWSVFELVWEWDNTPRGTMVGGQIIWWTQNGVVTALDGMTMIGRYERLEEFDWAEKKSHKMRIYTLPKIK